MSDNTLQEFLVSLGFKVDTNTERKFNASLKNAVLQANLLAAAIEGTAKIVATGVDSMARSFAQLEWSSERTKSSVQSLRDFAYGFSQIGGTVAGANATVERFAANIRSNPGMGSWLKQLGVTTQGRQSVDQMIDLVQRLSKQYSGNNYGIGAKIASQFGIDEESYYQISHNSESLAKFRKQYDDTTKSLGLNNDDAAKKWRAFMQDMQQTSMVFQTVMEKVFTDLEPKIQDGLEKFNTWLIANEPAIERAITTVGGAISDTAEDFHDLAVAVAPVIKQINDLVESITGQKGLTVAIEGLVGAAVLGRLLRMLSFFGGGALASGGGLMAGLAGLLVDPAYPAELNTPEGHAKLQADLAADAKDPLMGKLWKRFKTWAGFGGSSSGTSTGSSSKLNLANPTNADQNALETYRMSRAAGLSRNAALGILGSEEQESGFNPHTIGDGGTAFSSFQHHADRVADIKNGTGIDLTDPNISHADAVRAMLWEGQHGKDEGARKAFEMMKDAPTPAIAGAIFSKYFERPGKTPQIRAAEAYHRGVNANRWDGRITDVAGTDPFRYLGGPMGAADNSRKISQSTTINVHGVSDPAAAATEVARKQQGVNATLQRNTQGAVR